MNGIEKGGGFVSPEKRFRRSGMGLLNKTAVMLGLGATLGLGGRAAGAENRPTTIKSEEEERQIGKERIEAEMVINATVVSGLAQLSPELTTKTNNPDGSVSFDVIGRLNYSSAITELIAGNRTERDFPKAENTITVITGEIIQKVNDQDGEKNAVIAYGGLLKHVSETVNVARDGKVWESPIFGELENVGDLVEVMEKLAWEIYNIFRDDGMERQPALKLVAKILLSAVNYAEIGDPQKVGKIIAETINKLNQ